MIPPAACPLFQVELELRAQVRLFQELTGHLPHHMDGHQHVHVLPGTAFVHQDQDQAQNALKLLCFRPHFCYTRRSFLCSAAGVREAFAKVLSDFRIPYTRVPVETGLHSCSWLPNHLRNFYEQVEKDALDSIPVFRRYGIRCVSVPTCSSSLLRHTGGFTVDSVWSADQVMQHITSKALTPPPLGDRGKKACFKRIRDPPQTPELL